MSDAACKLLEQALTLPEEERLELVTAILASVDGAPDKDWEHAWTAEADRRIEDARKSGDSGDEWSEVRSRVLARRRLMRLRLLPEAEEELLAAARWYEDKRPGSRR